MFAVTNDRINYTHSNGTVVKLVDSSAQSIDDNNALSSVHLPIFHTEHFTSVSQWGMALTSHTYTSVLVDGSLLAICLWTIFSHHKQLCTLDTCRSSA